MFSRWLWASLVLAGFPLLGASLGTAFTYQGRLDQAGVPATGLYDFRFGLYGVAEAGAPVAGFQTQPATPVTNGQFTVALDFGPDAFPGEARWLEIGVRTGTNEFTTLSPRQPLLPVPAALVASRAGSADGLTQPLPAAQLPAAVARLDAPQVFSSSIAASSFSGTFSGNGAGLTGIPLSALGGGIVGAGPLETQASACSVSMGSQDNGIRPRWMAAADFNGDGRADMAVIQYASPGTLVLWTNLANGTWAASAPWTVGGFPSCVVAADLNGDQRMDLLTTHDLDSRIAVLWNQGNGFALSNTPAYYSNIKDMGVADLNGDGWKDVVCVNDNGYVQVATNNGAGQLGVPPASFYAGGTSTALALADVDGNRALDVLVANPFGGEFRVLTNDGAGGLVLAGAFPAGSYPYLLAAFEANGDGRPDVATANYGDGTLSVLTNNGRGGFVAMGTLNAGMATGPNSLAAGDLNGDGRADLVAGNFNGKSLNLFTNGGPAGFSLATTHDNGTWPGMLSLADVNGDGGLDVLAAPAYGGNPTVLLLKYDHQVSGNWGFQGAVSGNFHGQGGGLTNLSADALVGGLTTNLSVLAPGGGTNVLCFTNGVLRAVRQP